MPKKGRRMPRRVEQVKKMPELRPKDQRPVRLSDAYPEATYNRISRRGTITKKPRWA